MQKRWYDSEAKRQRIWNAFKRELVCEHCGFTGHSECIDFHHEDRKAKKMNLGGRVRGRSGPRSLATKILEADKCKVLCANCHRSWHAAIAYT